MDGKKQKHKRRVKQKKPNWSRRRPGRPKKKKWMPPRTGRSEYDKFRANEVMDVANEIRMFVGRERIHEKQPGGPGRPPAKKRDILKCLLLLEYLNCKIQKSPSMLRIFKDVLKIDKIPAPRTLYKYRAMSNMTGILERLLDKSAHELWMKETIAATDATGNPYCNGKNWRKDRDDFKKHRGYDKAHYIVGTRSLVIPYKRVTRGTWSDLPEFEPLVQNSVPGSNITQIVADSGYVDISNYELAVEYGATPYIKPKDNAVYRPHPSNAYERMVHYATKFPKRWKEVYRFRVKAECAIHSKKATFGDIIRGKYPPSRRNQELLRDIVHNFRMTLMERYGS